MFRALSVFLHLVWELICNRSKAKKCAELPIPERWQVSLPIVQKLVKGIMYHSGARVVYHGLENIPEDQNVFFIANHQSYFDIPILMDVMDRGTGFVAKQSLEKVPLLRQWMENIGCLFIDRDDVKQSVQIIRQASEQMKQGLNMVIFPEGTRSRGGATHEFKRGSVKPAFLAGVPVVPVCIDGAYKIFEGNKGFRVTPAEVHVYIGQPIETQTMTKAEQREFASKLEEVIFRQKEEVR